MSYAAVVCKISVRPHPNADRLQLGTCLGNQVVVGLDAKDEELGAFFPTDGQLSHEYCVENHLYTASARKRLGLPERPAGFFGHNRRVRAQKFRQERSDGLWMPLESLLWTGVGTETLKEGDIFTEWGGYGICQKYYTPATLRAMGGQKFKRRDAKCFPKHDDTKQFRFVADQIPEDAVIYLSEKLHGTSGRYGHIYDELPLPRWKDLLNRGLSYAHLPTLPARSGWRYLNGSKNVIIEKSDQRNNWYGTDEFRYNLTKDIRLHKGEVLYFEIVGWANEATSIMPPHDVTKTGLKEIRAQYGDQIHYTYGCPQGICRLYVYKIVIVNEDGVAWELSWPDVVRRCGELGLVHVPRLQGPLTPAMFAELDGTATWRDRLREEVEMLTEGASVLSPTQIREGVVIRVESRQGITHIKNKQWVFGVLEGYLSEDEGFVDPEEAA